MKYNLIQCIVILFVVFVITTCTSSVDTNTPEPTKYTVTFDKNYPGANNTISPQKVTSGDNAVPPTPDPERTKYKFGDWYETQTVSVDSKPFDFSNAIILKDITLYAHWIEIFTVSFDVNKPSRVTTDVNPPRSISVGEGEKALKPIDPIITDYTFEGWFSVAMPATGAVAFDFNTLISGDKTLYAKWKLAPITKVDITSIGPAYIGVDYPLIALITGGEDKRVNWEIVTDPVPAGISLDNNILKSQTSVAVDTSIVVKVTTVKDGETVGQKLTAENQIIFKYPPVTAINITSVGPAFIEKDYTLVANVTGGITKTIIWTIEGTTPDGISVEDGILKGNTVIPGTTIVVVATSTEDGETAGVKVVEKQTIVYSTLSITSANAITIGKDLALTASVSSSGSQSATWTIQEPTPAGVSIDGNILKSAVGTATPGDVTVNLLYAQGSQTFTLTQVISLSPPVTGVSISSSNTVVIGTDLTLQATIEPVAAIQTVMWAITTSPVPEGVSIDNGILKTVSGTAVVGTISVTATSGDDSSKLDTQTISLVLATTGVTIADIPSGTTPTIGTPLMLTAIVAPTDASQTVTWSIPTAVSGYSIDATTGELTSDGTVTVLIVDVVATSGTGTGAIASPEKTITFVRPALIGLTLTRKADQRETKAILNTAIDLTSVFDVGSEPTNADKSVTWSVTVPDGSAAAGTVETGTSMLTATALGDLTVTVTSTVDTTKTISKTITVVRPTLVSLSLTRKMGMVSTTAIIGTDLDLATVFDVGSEPTDADKSVTWSVSVPTTGSTAAGTVATDTSMLTATAPGNLTVTVTSTVDTTKTTTVTIMVVRPALVSLSLTRKAGMELTTAIIGTDLDLATVFEVGSNPADADKSVAWSVSVPDGSTAAGTVASGTSTLSSMLTATAPGNLTVTVTSTVDTTKTITKTIMVVRPTLVSLSLTRKMGMESTTAIIGTDLDLATVFDVGSEPTDADKSVTWSVSVPTAGSTAAGTVATDTSMLTATAPGNLTVTVTSTVDTTKTTTVTIMVVRPTLIGLTLTRKTSMESTMAIIGTDLDLATVFDVGVNPTDADKSVTWSVSVPDGSTAAGTVATDTSMLTATAPGNLTVTVTSTADPTETSALTIMVVRPTLVSLSLTRKMGMESTTAIIGTDLDLATVFDVGSEPTDADKSVTWSVSVPNGSTAAGTVATDTSMLTATAPGNLTVTVTSTVDPTKTITKTIMVVRPTLVSLSLTRKTGQGMTTAVVNTAIDLASIFDVGSEPADADKSVAWSVSTPAGSAAAGTVMGTSLTATVAGTLTVTVTSTVDTTKTSAQTIMVVRPTLNRLTLTRKTGQGMTTAVVNTAIDLASIFDVGSEPADADKSVAWSVSTPAGSAAAGTVMGTSLTATVAGTLTVTVTSTVDTTKTSALTIMVVRPTLNRLTLTRKTGQGMTTAVVNTAIDLASIFDVGSEPADADKSVAWSVSTPAGSAAAGTVMGTSLTATVAGTLTVTVTSTVDTTKTTTETIMVVRPTLNRLTLTRKTGQEMTTAVVNTAIDLASIFDVGSEPTDADKSVTWSVSASTGSTAVGTVASGTSMLTATAAGTLTVTVTSTVDTTKTTTETIMVVRPTLNRLTLTRKTGQEMTTAVVNTAIDLASIFDVGSEPADADKSVTWSVSASTGSTAVGTVASGTSMLTATAAGTLTVTVTSTVDTTKTTTETIMVVP